MAFQTTIANNIGFGVAGSIRLVGPYRGQPARLISPSAANNVLGRAFTIVDDATATFDTGDDPQPLDVRAGGTGVFAGIAVNPLTYEAPLDGLDPSLTLPNNTLVELAQQAAGLIVALGQGVAIGDFIYFDQITGVLSAASPSASAPVGTTRVPGGRVTRYKSALAGLVIIEFDDNAGAAAGPALTAARSTNAGFAPILELSPSSGIADTTRAVSAPFNEPFRNFQVVYGVYRVRTPSFTASVDNGAGAAGDILNVTAVSQGAVVEGMGLTNAGLTAGTYVKQQLTGEPQGVGTYKLNQVQAAVITSSTFTSTWLVDELYQGAGSVITYEAAFEDAVTQSNTGIAARPRVQWGGANSYTYNYATWDKAEGEFISDMCDRGRVSADPIAIWTRTTLPANGNGIPSNKGANSFFANRYWGNERVTSGTSADPATATSIPAISGTTSSGSTLVVVPLRLIIYTAGVAKTVAFLTDSRGAFTGLGINEPAGFGDSQGDLYGRGSAMERGGHGVALQHTFMVSKPTERAFWLARARGAWRLRRRSLQRAAPDVVVNALGQNDQPGSGADLPTTWTANMDLPVGQPITTSNRVYIVTASGTSGATAPTSTTMGVDIALGTATIRYLGTDANAVNRTGLAIAGKNLVINNEIKLVLPSADIVQDELGPYSSTNDNFATATGQSVGFNSAAGIAYQQGLAANGAAWTGATRRVSVMSLLGGSSTVTGGPNDGSRFWITDPAAVPYFATPDGIHHGNRGAEIGKPAYNKLALTGAA